MRFRTLMHGGSLTVATRGSAAMLAPSTVAAQAAPTPVAMPERRFRKNPALAPEVKLTCVLERDHRFGTDSAVRGDIQETIIHNVFAALARTQTVPLSSTWVHMGR